LSSNLPFPESNVGFKRPPYKGEGNSVGVCSPWPICVEYSKTPKTLYKKGQTKVGVQGMKIIVFLNSQLTNKLV